MGNVGLAEILVITVIIFLVFGPERLPEFARQAGKFTRKFREITSKSMDELRSAADIDDIEGEFKSISGDLKGLRKSVTSELTGARKSATFDMTGTRGRRSLVTGKAAAAASATSLEKVPATDAAPFDPDAT